VSRGKDHIERGEDSRFEMDQHDCCFARVSTIIPKP
jgi:hypothetical protein